MLDALRRGAKTWVAKILLGLLVASFAAWGVADVIRWGGTTSVAEVGGTEIGVVEYQRAYTRQLQAMSRQLGQPVDRDFAMALGIPQQVLNQMVSEATLTAAAREFGIGVGDEQLAKEIAEDPALRPQGSDTFDRAYFQRLLRENGLTEPAYVADRRLYSLRSQLTDGLVGGLAAPEAYVAQFDRYRNETRTIEYAVLPTAASGPVTPPTDADIETWYEANKDRFEAPEYRRIAVLAATPDALADPSTVSDDAARAEYDRARADYTTAERRRVRQVLFPTVEEAREAAERIRGGNTLEGEIAARGLSPEDVDLGLVTREEIVDPAIAEVAFGLEPNAVSDPVEARFGGALVQVTEVVPEAVRPFDEVRDEIRASLAERDAERSVLEVYDEIEDARAGGATLSEVAQRFSMPLVTVETDASGLGRDGEVVATFPQSGDVLDASFGAEVGEENDPVRSGRGYVWYEVEEIVPAADRPLEEVREKVVAAWTVEKVAEALATRADEMAAALRDGGDFAALAEAAGTTVETATDLTRASNPEAFGPDGLEAVFAGPTGHVAAVPGNGDTRVVLRVTDVTVPPFFPESADATQVAAQLRNQLADSLLALYVDRTRAALGSTVDQQALQLAIGGTSN